MAFLKSKGDYGAMTISVFIGTSVDGFIARPNGDLDFLPEGGGEPHGFTKSSWPASIRWS
ncbi:MAG: hypothetical protein ABSB86_04760 [Bryobacteraceae bacterium]